MNAYSVEFFSDCPANRVRIRYRLRIETSEVLSVEDLVEAVSQIDEGFHEEIADALSARFGGVQTLVAEHHGVTIETTRRPKRRPKRSTRSAGGLADKTVMKGIPP